MYLKAISTAFSALSALSSIGRALGVGTSEASVSQAAPPPLAVSQVANGGAPVSFSRESLMRDTANFADTLRQKLAARGGDLTVAPVLASDAEGKVRVGNVHRDKGRIEALMAEDKTLQQQFAALSAQYSMQRTADSQSVFAADYARAGNDAAAYAGVVQRQVAYSRASFSLSVGAGGFTPVFSVAQRA